LPAPRVRLVREGIVPVVNPAALVPHEPTDPTPAELAELRTALNALVAEAEAV
jgi:hypothetical protein